MATLKLTWGSPLIDPSTIEEDKRWQNLPEVTKTVLSMRGVACAAILLPQAYHLWRGSQAVVSAGSYRDSAHEVLCVSLSESMLNYLLIAMRRMHMDLDPRSIGGAKLGDFLTRAPVREALHQRRLDPRNRCMALSRPEADKLLDWIQRTSVKLRPQGGRAKYWKSLDPNSVESHAYLVRKAADWRAAHMSMDEYKVGSSDIRSVLFNSLMVARAIQRFSGDDSTTGDFEDIDRVAYQNSGVVVGALHRDGLLIESLDANLDMHLGRI